MQRPSHRLDLCLVPIGPVREGPNAADLFDSLASFGFTDLEGGPGPQATGLVNGGFVRVRLDSPGRIALYANGQGGFRVFCPACDANVTGLWARSERAPQTVVTCVCGAATRMDTLAYRPPAAFAAWALVIGDAEDSRLVVTAEPAVRRLLGDVRTIARRVAR